MAASKISNRPELPKKRATDISRANPRRGSTKTKLKPAERRPSPVKLREFLDKHDYKVDEVAKELKRTPETVHKWMRGAGIQPRPGMAKKKAFLTAWVQSRGEVNQVARRLKVTRESVHNRRKKLGLIERDPSFISREELESALIATHRNTQAVADHFKRSISFINKLMREYGISNKGERAVSKQDLEVLLHYVGDEKEISKITGRNIHSLHRDIYRRGLSLKDFKNGRRGPGFLEQTDEAIPAKQGSAPNELRPADENQGPWHGSFFPTPLFPTASTEALRTFFRTPIMIL